MMTNEELFEEWWSGKSSDYQRMTAPIDIWLAACRISNEYMRKKHDPEDFIGACDPSLLSDSLPGQPKPRATMRLPERLDWDIGEMVPHSSGEYCDYENVCEILGERDAYIAELEAKLAAAERLADLLRRHDTAHKRLDVQYCKGLDYTLAEAYCDSGLYEDTQDALAAYQSQTKETL